MKKTITMTCIVLTMGMFNISFADANPQECEKITRASNCCLEIANLLDDLQVESSELFSEMPSINLTASVLNYVNCSSDCCMETAALLNDLQEESRELLNEMPAADLTASVLDHLFSITLNQDRKDVKTECHSTCPVPCKKMAQASN